MTTESTREDLINVIDNFCDGSITVIELFSMITDILIKHQNKTTDCISCGSDLSKRLG